MKVKPEEVTMKEEKLREEYKKAIAGYETAQAQDIGIENRIVALFQQQLEDQISTIFQEMEGIIGEDEEGKTLWELGSEFSTPRDYRRSARKYLKAEQRSGLVELKKKYSFLETLGGRK